MVKEKILVIGASGQIGVELTLALRKIYGNSNVVASDLREQNPLLEGTGPYVSLDVMNKEMLHVQVIRQNFTQIYLLAAILSATGRKKSTSRMALEYARAYCMCLILQEKKKFIKFTGLHPLLCLALQVRSRIVRNKR
jgi:nucleoside-diphosphate-sugar epimerase